MDSFIVLQQLCWYKHCPCEPVTIDFDSLFFKPPAIVFIKVTKSAFAKHDMTEFVEKSKDSGIWLVFDIDSNYWKWRFCN